MSISDDLNKAGEEARELSSAFKDIQQSVSDTNVGIQEAGASFKTLGNLADQLKQHNQGITKLTRGQIKGLQDQAKIAKDNLKTSRELLKSKIEGLTILAKQKPGNKAVNDELEHSLYVHDQITEQLEDQNSETSRLNKGLKGVRGSSDNIQKAFSGLSKIQIPFSEYLSPLMLINKIIGFIFSTAVDLDASIGDAAKSLNMTYSEAADMRKEMADAAEASGDLFYNSENTQKALLGINATLGSAVGFDQMNKSLQEDVVLMGKLQGFAGLTAEETEKIQKYTLATGQNATKATKALMAGYKVEGLKNKLVLNEKTALKEISKLSSAIKLSTKGGAAGLGEALANAKALGIDLGKVDDIAGSLLDFESSITAELEAELLLGKNINLEKARQAALDNDLATVASEIAKQTGGIAEFQEMNRIQQEAMAKAVGMTREELAGMLEEQTALKEMSMESAEIAEEEFNRLVEKEGITAAMEEMGENALTRQFEQQSLDEQANANQQKMADLLASELIPNMKFLAKNAADFFKTIQDTLKALGGMKMVLTVIGTIISVKLIQGMVQFLASVGKSIMATGILGAKAKQHAMAEASATAMKSTIGLGPAAIPAAIGLLATAAAVISAYTLMDDGAIPPGYGDRVLSTPKGKIAFNNDDTIVAGTNLGGGGGGMGQTNLLLQELIATIKTTGKVELDGQKVGDALNLGSYNIQ